MGVTTEDSLHKLRLPPAAGNSGSGGKRLNRIGMNAHIQTRRLKEDEGDSDDAGNSPHPVASRLARQTVFREVPASPPRGHTYARRYSGLNPEVLQASAQAERRPSTFALAAA